MRDASYLIAAVALLFLAFAGLAWFRIIRKPDREPPTRSDVKRGKSAAMLIVVAFCVSAVAAVVALIAVIRG